VHAVNKYTYTDIFQVDLGQVPLESVELILTGRVFRQLTTLKHLWH